MTEETPTVPLPFKITIWGYSAIVQVYPTIETVCVTLSHELTRRIGITAYGDSSFYYSDSSSARMAIHEEVTFLEKKYLSKVEVYGYTRDGQTPILNEFSSPKEKS